MSSPKSYVDRAVQTHSNGLTTSNCDTLASEHLAYVGTNEAGISDANLCLDTLQLSLESAYIQPLRQDKYPITYSRPSGQISARYDKRVMSLPDSASLCSANTVIETRTRVVSMPEHLNKLDSNVSKTQTQSPVSPDAHFYSSNISKPAHIHQRKRERPYPSDMPRTPTPPSSPDSVLIIGIEESKVSESFLRRQQIDEHGWITWASSPPRPIPALHGPLSLPYARCPSGAEGTVIEGDDLSHKIWGLGVDDVQGHSRGIRPTTQSGASRNTLSVVDSQRDYQEKRLGIHSLHHRDEVIDLSKPSSFLEPIELKQDIFDRWALLGTRSHISPLTERSGQIDGRSSFDNNAPFAINLDNSSRDPLILGHDGHNLLVSGANAQTETSKGRRGRNNLNKSAPVFVPASLNDIQTPSLGVYMRGNNEYASDAYSQIRNPANYASVTPHYHQPNNDLITPPSTLSPRWSPVFTPQHSAINLKEPILTHDVHPLMCRIPMIQSPDLQDDYSGNRFVMHSNIQGVDDVHEQCKPVQKFGHVGTCSSIDVGFFSADLKDFTRSALRPEASTISLALNGQSAESTYGVVQTDPALERRRNLSYQQPRSIPLARLIQRRLSSVAEEDATFKHENLPPLSQKNLPNSSFKRLATEPLHAQCSINQTSVSGLSGLGMVSREEAAQFRFLQGRTTLAGGSAEFRATSPLRISPSDQKRDAMDEIEDVHGKENQKSATNPTDRKADQVGSKKVKPRKRKSSGSTSAPTQRAAS